MWAKSSSLFSLGYFAANYFFEKELEAVLAIQSFSQHWLLKG
jgi:hypothetical protein